jgi:hypothetical protein
MNGVQRSPGNVRLWNEMRPLCPSAGAASERADADPANRVATRRAIAAFMLYLQA